MEIIRTSPYKYRPNVVNIERDGIKFLLLWYYWWVVFEALYGKTCTRAPAIRTRESWEDYCFAQKKKKKVVCTIMPTRFSHLQWLKSFVELPGPAIEDGIAWDLLLQTIVLSNNFLRWAFWPHLCGEFLPSASQQSEQSLRCKDFIGMLFPLWQMLSNICAAWIS